VLILTDLDDTLFQTARKCPRDDGALVAMSTLADGSDSGFASQRQQRLLAWLAAGEVVPVTARSRELLARVKLRQAPAICSNGGCIVGADGQLDQDWHARLVVAAAGVDAVSEIYRLIADRLDGQAFRHWTVVEAGLALYIVVKSNHDDGVALEPVQPRVAALLPADWRIHRNGNNLAILPPWLNKRHAAHYLIERARATDPHRLVVGLGDSYSDVGFMDLCDYAMTPTTSQVWQHLRRENVWC